MLAERVLMGMLIGGIAIGCAFVLKPFFTPILWAAILVFTTFPVFEYLRKRLRLSHGAAASLMVVITALFLVIPLALVVPNGAQDAEELRKQIQTWIAGGIPASPDWIDGIPLIGPTLRSYWDNLAFDFSGIDEIVRPYLGTIAESGLSILLSIGGGVLQFVLALLIAFFLWMGGEVMATRIVVLLRRIAGDYADRLIDVTGATVRGVVYGILGTAIVQGILTALGLWMSGVPRPAMLGALAGLISVLPIGAPSVWIPASIWLIATGHTAWGIILFVYGLVFVSGADTLIRPYFVARGASLPFLLTFLGVLGGALAFGLLGIFLGPVLLGVGFTLVAEFGRIRTAEPLWKD